MLPYEASANLTAAQVQRGKVLKPEEKDRKKQEQGSEQACCLTDLNLLIVVMQMVTISGNTWRQF